MFFECIAICQKSGHQFLEEKKNLITLRKTYINISIGHHIIGIFTGKTDMEVNTRDVLVEEDDELDAMLEEDDDLWVLLRERERESTCFV
jgi:uncharacterized radical SAM superfamily protein